MRYVKRNKKKDQKKIDERSRIGCKTSEIQNWEEQTEDVRKSKLKS